MRSIVVLTGAGISAESGLQTFRGADGLWEGHRVEDVATPEAFAHNPDLVYEFYNERRRPLLTGEIQPNPAHLALAQFEQDFPGDFLLVTQNVDDLHERAGSRNVLHMHGEILKARLADTGEVFSWRKDLDAQSQIPPGAQGKGPLRPHIVWFGEMPLELDRIFAQLEACDLFVAIGTSGQVYPAAGFVNATGSHCRRVLLNLEDTMGSPLFDESYLGPASERVPSFFQGLL